jgi:tRNA1(Val) A37 N6-methylase TrmN6
MLKASERFNALLTHQLQIIQSDEVFSFSLDAVLLARFCSVPARGQIVDLCSGNGVIPLLLSTRTNASIVGVEIQPRLADMAKRSVDWNQLTSQIAMIEADLRSYPQQAGHGSVDLVTVNPPYLSADAGTLNENHYVARARHEIDCTLADVVRVSAQLLRSGGRLAMVHRPARLIEILQLLTAHKLQPKRLRFVHPTRDGEANMLLIEALKDGKPELRLLPPLIVHDGAEYSPEVHDIMFGHADSLRDGEEKHDATAEKFSEWR